MRLIDADALEKSLETTSIRIAAEKGKMFRLIADAPTIDPESVRPKGEWEIIADDYDCELMQCSVCGNEFYDGDNDTVDTLHNFCPHCGADMRYRR